MKTSQQKTHPLFTGSPGKYQGIPDEVAIAFNDYARRMINEALKHALKRLPK